MDVQVAPNTNVSRRLDALRVAAYNVEKLEFHLSRSTRILNDLRSLRRLLFEERMHRTADSRAKAEEVVISTESSDGHRHR
jgi:hypothetical protein